MRIEEIAYGSTCYEAAKRLRHEVLRLPLGLRLSAEDTDGEAEQIHIAALEDGALIGSVILKPLAGHTVKLRQMAVAAGHQGRHIGKKLVLFAENRAKEQNFACIELHARVYAQGFYEKLGYVPTGEVFTEVTVPTIKMYKPL